MPFYISTVADPTKVLRAIVVWPGKPRDIWKYANLMLNARNVAVTNFNQQGVTNDSFVIIAPAMLNQLDLQAGAARPKEIVFHGSSWQRGAPSRNPPMKHAVTSYAAVDQIIDDLFNRTSFPNLNQVVVAGHSMGGQATQRYALMKKTKVYDNNVRFWIGNPGSWAWLTDARPYSNASCAAGNEYDTWPYGLNGNQTKLTSYARKDVIANKTYVIDRFLNRQVSYALALLDIGAGDTHCQARWQGGNHLDRGSQFVLQYQNASSFYLNGKQVPAQARSTTLPTSRIRTTPCTRPTCRSSASSTTASWSATQTSPTPPTQATRRTAPAPREPRPSPRPRTKRWPSACWQARSASSLSSSPRSHHLYRRPRQGRRHVLGLAELPQHRVAQDARRSQVVELPRLARMRRPPLSFRFIVIICLHTTNPFPQDRFCLSLHCILWTILFSPTASLPFGVHVCESCVSQRFDARTECRCVVSKCQFALRIVRFMKIMRNPMRLEVGSAGPWEGRVWRE